MPHATHTVMTAMPRGEGFAFLADADNDSSWCTGVIRIRGQVPLAIGARNAQPTAGHFGRPIAADIELTDDLPDTRSASK